jgi:hypothetical protein
MSVSPSRRAVLRVALGAPLAAACTRSRAKRPAQPDPDDALRQAAILREQALLTRYDAAAAASPALAAQIAAIRAEHIEHLAALGHSVPSPGTPSSPPTTAGPPPTLAQLAAAERAAAAEHTTDALQASRGLAVVLATLAASEASHPVGLA